MAFGYWGKILRVDLSRGEISTDEHDESWYRTYMGGACIGAYYLLRELAPGTDPFSPDNIIVSFDGTCDGMASPITISAPYGGYTFNPLPDGNWYLTNT